MRRQERIRQLEEEIERRIQALEAGGGGGGRFSARDYIAAAVVVLFCLAAVIGGAWI